MLVRHAFSRPAGPALRPLCGPCGNSVKTAFLSHIRAPGSSGGLDAEAGGAYSAFMFTLFTYMALIVGVNWGFAVTPLIALPNGEMWPPMSLVVGFIFVVRDYAQRRVGHKVLWAMLVGCVVSWYMATPQLAVASAAAFAVGELGDWALYTFTNRPFSQRILISSLVSAPLDSIVFLGLIGLATPWSVVIMSLSKLVGALLVFCLVRRREQRAYALVDPRS
ncbi:VUT family protein [Desulfovibrio sp. AM18-2]|nr:VUT family protein [Desulfovibrio sp. AM18-2]